jgi:B12-binding domain/radical SAM domain protein
MPKVDLALIHAPSVYDFRNESIMYGPMSDVVPSTPVFEMYPIGFVSIAEYLERYGFNVRIINLAVRMLNGKGYNPEKVLRSLRARAFGIDLHWLPHAHGSIEVAKRLKQYHPDIPVIFGGLSSSYFHEELISYPCVDYVLRGDSTEKPLSMLMDCIKKGVEPAHVPNLTWKDSKGDIHINPLSHVPDDIDDIELDYHTVVRSVLKYRDLANFMPFKDWLEYPITAVFSCRGCNKNCITCGGSSFTFNRFFNRPRTVFRSPQSIVKDMKSIQKLTKAPIILIGDIRMNGEDYADEFLDRAAKAKIPNRVIIEFFSPAPREFLTKVSRAFRQFTIEMSCETHDEEIRAVFGKKYLNRDLENTIENACALGCERFDIFFMTGLSGQTYDSVMDTAEYGKKLVAYTNGHERVFPFISPLAPFLDPGSLAFEFPERYGYKMSCRTLEEHRQALIAPSWKYIMNYETEWMTRDEIVFSTYEAGLRLNRIKADRGLVDRKTADVTEKRILRAMDVIREIDTILDSCNMEDRKKKLKELKPVVDRSNISTVCEKNELNLPVGLFRFNIPRIVKAFFRSHLESFSLALRREK